MTFKYRDRSVIVAELLNYIATSEIPVTQTKLLYHLQSNSGFTRMMVRDCEAQGLITFTKQDNNWTWTISITAKGYQVNERYQEMKALCPDLFAETQPFKPRKKLDLLVEQKPQIQGKQK